MARGADICGFCASARTNAAATRPLTLGVDGNAPRPAAASVRGWYFYRYYAFRRTPDRLSNAGQLQRGAARSRSTSLMNLSTSTGLYTTKSALTTNPSLAAICELPVATMIYKPS